MTVTGRKQWCSNACRMRITRQQRNPRAAPTRHDHD